MSFAPHPTGFDLAREILAPAAVAPKRAHRRVLKARIPADLIDKVYRAEGWTRREGEVRAARVKQFYDLSTDARAGLYVATPKAGV